MRLHLSNRPITRLANPGWLQLFAVPPAPAPAPTPDPAPAPGDKHKVPIVGKPDPKPADPPTPAPQPITFPDQASLQARLDRASKSGKEALAKELGFESVETMAAAAKAAKAAEEAAKTEQQKLAEAKEAAEKRATEAETKATETQTKSDQKIIKTELRSLAREMGAIDVEDVEALIGKTGKEITIDEEGNVTGVQEALDALKTAKPHLFGTAKGPAPAPNIGGPMNPPRTPPASMLDASQEEFAAELRRLGMRPHSSTRSKAEPNRKG